MRWERHMLARQPRMSSLEEQKSRMVAQNAEKCEKEGETTSKDTRVPYRMVSEMPHRVSFSLESVPIWVMI